ncbi:MAG: alanine racemase [Clostridia bacterium]|nr:alanine racemase [Clostridia bacterium]
MSKKRVEAIIDLGAVISNYDHIKNKLAPNTKLLSVVKADAYGHGAIEVCRALEKHGATEFAVACVEEAIALREGGVKGNILILGITDESYAKTLEKYSLTQTVDGYQYACALSKRAKIKVHVKVDTGMSRLGLYCHKPEDAVKASEEIKKIHELDNITIDGIFTHFAESDSPSGDFTRRQYESFCALLNKLEADGIKVGTRHCCNSAGIINYPEMQLDMVRAGIILYGLYPSAETVDDKLIPAMKLVSRVSSVSEIDENDTVSYGRSYRPVGRIKKAVVSIGYADGLSRVLSGKATLRINGVDVPVIGNICMDLCMADVTGCDCKVGDEVVVFENNEDVNRLADLANTINYEIVCSVKNRVPRKYID